MAYRMAAPGPDHRPGEFLQEVVFLVGGFGRGENADGVGAGFGFDLLQAARNKF